MIESLKGIHETIDYGNSPGFRIFHNRECEDFPEHWHTGIEILMPTTGTYTAVVGKSTYDLHEEDIFIMNSGVLHSLKAPPAGERIILQFDVASLCALSEMDTIVSILPSVIFLSKECERGLYFAVKAKMEDIVREYDEKETFYEARIYAQLINIIVEVCRTIMKRQADQGERVPEGQITKQKEYLEVIMNVCNYINKHYQENLTLEEIAGISGFSKFHFTRVFKQYMNMTFYEYLNSRRVQRAKELLYSKELSITDVAMNSGFSSLSAFNRTFKSANSCSPSEFRNKVL